MREKMTDFMSKFFVSVLGVTLLHGVLVAGIWEDKQSAIELVLKEAITSKEKGNYDQSKALSEKALVMSEEIAKLSEVRKRQNWLWYRIAVAQHLGAEEKKNPGYQRGFSFSVEGAEIVDASENDEKELDLALEVIEKGIVEIDKVIAFLKGKVGDRGEIVVERLGMTNYVVKFLPARRESLWRIAAYDFIFGDGKKWRLIYRENKSKIKDPDLIYPGQALVIPALNREKEDVVLVPDDVNEPVEKINTEAEDVQVTSEEE